MECAAFLLERDLAMHVGSRVLSPPRAGEALVRVEWAGVCGSDLHVMRTGDWVTEWPATLGHEIYGRVEASSAGGLAPGTPVVIDSRIPCGVCSPCGRGERDDCRQIRFVGEACAGGFATHCVLPVELLHSVPKTLDGAVGVLAEPLAVAMHALGHLDGEPPERAAILGHGPIGALVHIELRRRFPDCEIDVAEPAPLRASLARAFGARSAASAGELPADSFDLVIDAAGYRASLRDVVALCRREAGVLLLALSEQEVALRPMELVEKRLRITGVNAFRDELPAAITRLVEEPWRYAPVITDAIGLAELPDRARHQLERPDAIKVLVSP